MTGKMKDPFRDLNLSVSFAHTAIMILENLKNNRMSRCEFLVNKN